MASENYDDNVTCTNSANHSGIKLSFRCTACSLLKWRLQDILSISSFSEGWKRQIVTQIGKHFVLFCGENMILILLKDYTEEISKWKWYWELSCDAGHWPALGERGRKKGKERGKEVLLSSEYYCHLHCSLKPLKMISENVWKVVLNKILKINIDYFFYIPVRGIWQMTSALRMYHIFLQHVPHTSKKGAFMWSKPMSHYLPEVVQTNHTYSVFSFISCKSRLGDYVCEKTISL